MVAGHCSAAVVRWCRAGPGGGPGRLVAALPGRSVQIVTRAFVPAVITFPADSVTVVCALTIYQTANMLKLVKLCKVKAPYDCHDVMIVMHNTY